MRVRQVVIATALSLGVLGLGLAGPALAASAQPGSSLTLAAEDDAPSIVTVLQEVSGSLVGSDGTTHGPYDEFYEGTGFFISSNGYIVTAAHVAAPDSADVHRELADAYIDGEYNCDPATASDECDGVEQGHEDSVIASTTLVHSKVTISVLTQQMSPYADGLPATVVTSSEDTDLDVAVLKIAGANEPVTLLAPTAANSLGDPLAVIGYPASSENGPGGPTMQPTLTTGSVTALLDPDSTRFNAAGAHLVQTDAHVEHGNSGGPGVGTNGQVLGIVSFGDLENDNFLVSTDDVLSQVDHTPARNHLGTIDSLWRNGLAAQAAGNQSLAVKDFTACAKLNPDQVYCVAKANGQSLPIAGLAGNSAGAASFSLSQPTGGNRAALAGFVIILCLVSGGLVLLALRRPAHIPTPAWGLTWAQPGQPPTGWSPPSMWTQPTAGYPPAYSPPPGWGPPTAATWIAPPAAAWPTAPSAAAWPTAPPPAAWPTTPPAPAPPPATWPPPSAPPPPPPGWAPPA